ncbi:hypothetical protein [Gorillibacterium sp. CAU 1737]|uniref:hypothetical protein n=1 Tax=Gorillibacterium sp. CAU 1737 TaxID=3140362 RepID=UPI003260CC47
MKHRNGNTLAVFLTLAIAAAPLACAAPAAAFARPEQAADQAAPPIRYGHPEPHHRAERLLQESAAVLGMSKEELHKELMAGKSLSDVAAAKGISRQQLLTALKAKSFTRLDREVEAGSLSKEAAAAMKERVSSKLPELIERKGFLHAGKKGGPRGLLTPRLPELAASLGMTKEGLERELASGKSLAEIAGARGMSRQQLLAKLKEQLTPVLEQLIDHKRHPAAQKGQP